MQCPKTDDHDLIHEFDPQEGDSCWARLDPTENVWSKGFVRRKVIGVPDSCVVEIDGRKYHHNKRDLTFSPPDDDNKDESDSDNHHADQNVPKMTRMCQWQQQ